MDAPCDKFVPLERTCRIGRNMALWCCGCRAYWPSANPSDRHVIMWLDNMPQLRQVIETVELMKGGAE